MIADVGGPQGGARVRDRGTLEKGIAGIKVPGGYRIQTRTATAPFDTARYGIKWDGEWHITYEVFRDLGLAFAAVLVLIYILVVGWFRSFTVPLVIMAPIPLSLVGILPAHWLFGAFFTATSMIGFIAGAGIIVRNSIILVDFIELRRRQGMPLSEAVVDAGEVRFRPMLLTAAAVVVGSPVMLFDPIFQGLAVSMMAGEVAATLLSRAAVPVLYYLLKRSEEKREAKDAALVLPRARKESRMRPKATIQDWLRGIAGGFVLLSVGAGLVRPSGVLPVHRVRRREPAAVRHYEDLPDVVAAGPTRRAGDRGEGLAQPRRLMKTRLAAPGRRRRR